MLDFVDVTADRPRDLAGAFWAKDEGAVEGRREDVLGRWASVTPLAVVLVMVARRHARGGVPRIPPGRRSVDPQYSQ